MLINPCADRSGGKIAASTLSPRLAESLHGLVDDVEDLRLTHVEEPREPREGLTCDVGEARRSP